ncbi:MAG: anthranilate synthase component 1 [Planctomycetota bacterium]
MEHAAFTNAVESMQADIGAGEYFQAVLSRRQESPPTTDPLELYRCLRLSNSSPHMFFFESEWATLVGSSPERLVSLEGALCETVPIAGTRPRAANTDEDRKLGAELLADSKERAEHDMLVDLARNDLGRVSQVGSITVPQYATLTRFPKVQHLVSRVEARLRNDLDALDLLAACFPAGTVSGAPKIRAMKAIAQHENEARGPYGGAFGYLSDDGNLDMAIVIRTFVIHAGQVHIQAGAGIVWDSIPDSEFEETGHKAKGMLEALTLSQSPAFQRPLCQSPTLPTS